MAENTNNVQKDDAISDEQLKNVSGGNKIQKQRLEQLDTHDSSKSVEDIQAERLTQLDNSTK
ncbi:MAG: hypothetical protein AAF703_11735 [Cyanobacteria bacterium P01_D01_bin.105]